MTELFLMRVLLFASIAAYYVYIFMNRHEVQDERAKVIHLKTLVFVHRMSEVVLLAGAAAYLLVPKLDAIYLLGAFAVTWFLAYPAGNVFLKRQM